MSIGFTTQAFQDVLAFPLRAPGAKSKLAIAAVLSLAGLIIPILPGLFVLGYGGSIMRRMIKDKGEPYLPEWTDLNEMFMLGLRLGGAIFVYNVPALLVVLLSYAGMMAPAFAAALSSPSHQQMDRWLGLSLLSSFGGMAGMGLGFALILVTWILLPPVMGHVVANNSFAAAFRVREWWRVLRANIGGFLVAMILVGGVYMGLVIVMQALYMTIILCLLIPFLAAIVGAYLVIISGIVFAQAYNEALAKLDSPAQPVATAPA